MGMVLAIPGNFWWPSGMSIWAYLMGLLKGDMSLGFLIPRTGSWDTQKITIYYVFCI